MLRIIENPYNCKPKAIVTPLCSASSTSLSTSSTISSPTKYSSTQEAISAVQEELQNFRAYAPSVHHKSMEFIGQGVRELKQEVLYLRNQLESARQKEEFLCRKLAYFEQKEEAELISLSQENDRSQDLFKRNQKYSRYSNANFSPNFNRVYK